MFSEEWTVFPAYYSGHLLLAFGAILTGLIFSVPLGIAAFRSEKLSGPALGFASVIQTIPGLALLALMVPLMGGRIGFWPAFAALALYSILPILRNTIVGLQGVDPAVREAALGAGMSETQRLRQVDLPLAAPVIVAGLRTASVWVVGAATLSTPVGATSLGNYIFQGLQTRNWGAVLFGCIISAGLALALDQVIRLFQMSVEKRRRIFAYAGVAGLALIAAPALSVFMSAEGRAGSGVSLTEVGQPLTNRQITIAAKGFTEQYILAELISRQVEAEGGFASVREGLGSAVAFDALTQGEIDVMVDYSGTTWATVMKRDDMPPRAMLNAIMTGWLIEEHGVLAFAPLGFENAYAFAVTRETAETYGLETIEDLVGEDLAIASDPEFFGRPEWTRTRDAYGLTSLTPRGMDATFMYDAVKNKEVDIITAYTTDARIDAYDLVLLEDTLGSLPPYDAFILLSPDASEDRALMAALEPLRSAIPSETMRGANGRVDLERESVDEAVHWLEDALAKN